MLCSYLSGNAKRVKPVFTLLLGSITAILVCWSSWADTTVPPGSAGTEWNIGPTTGALGSLAEIKVPAGYKFLDAQGARAFLAGRNQAPPRNLLGLLAPSSENWWAVLQFANQGYCQHPEAAPLNPAEILQALATSGSSPAPGKPPASPAPAWELPPAYDAQAHTLEWAVRKQKASQLLVVHTVRLLCRHGSVDATVVAPYRGFSDLAPLKTLAQNISLKAGERYEDYQSGDKVCSAGLAALVADNDVLTAAGDSAAGSRFSRTLWLGGEGAACAIVLSGVWFYARAARRKPRRHRAPEPETHTVRAPVPGDKAARPPLVSSPAPAPAMPAAALNGAAHPAPKVRPAAARFQPRTEALRKPLNGKSQGARRRKVFDYNRYFTDLMGAVSANGLQLDSPVTNGAAVDPARFALPPAGMENAPSPAPASTFHQHAELLASQRELIEEQKRLIQEQNKLIEEKSRLIAEKNELLQLQSHLMNGKLAEAKSVLAS